MNEIAVSQESDHISVDCLCLYKITVACLQNKIKLLVFEGPELADVQFESIAFFCHLKNCKNNEMVKYDAMVKEKSNQNTLY
jgi:hypothetical protein